MEISLKIDYKGKPYLSLYADGSFPTNDERVINSLLSIFIREGRKKGLIIKNESALEFCNDYASIHIKEE